MQGRAPGELKHLSTSRKGNHSPSSGERTGKSLNHHIVRCDGVVGLGTRELLFSGRSQESSATEGDSPVHEEDQIPVEFLSTTGHANPVGTWGVHSLRLNTFGDR